MAAVGQTAVPSTRPSRFSPRAPTTQTGAIWGQILNRFQSKFNQPKELPMKIEIRKIAAVKPYDQNPVSYTHLRAHETL